MRNKNSEEKFLIFFAIFFVYSPTLRRKMSGIEFGRHSLVTNIRKILTQRATGFVWKNVSIFI